MVKRSRFFAHEFSGIERKSFEAILPGSRPFPKEVLIFLKSAAILFALAIVIVPELPQSLFLALNPATQKPYFVIRSHITVTQFNLFWGFLGFSKISLWLRIFFFLCTAFLTVLPLPKSEIKLIAQPFFLRGKQYVWLAGIIIFSTVVFYVFRIPYHLNVLFGDGATIPGDIDNGMVFPAEILTCYSFIWMKSVIAIIYPAITTNGAIVMTTCLSGGVFVGTLWMYGQRWGITPVGRIIFTLSGILTGCTAMFFGYIETTQMELMSFMMLSMSAVFVFTSVGRSAKRWEIFAFFSASLAFLFHAAGILLIPACFVFMMDSFNGTLRGFPWLSRTAIGLRHVLIIVGIVILPYFYMLVQPFFLQGSFGNITGGADHIMFVPLSFDYLHPVSPLISYSLFSCWHLADIFSAMFVTAPLSIVLLAAGIYTMWRCHIILTIAEWRNLLFLGLAAAGCLSVPLFWNHDFTMWGDWNLAGTYLFPFGFFAWVMCLTVFRHTDLSRNDFLRLFLPLLFVQAVSAIGIIGQMF